MINARTNIRWLKRVLMLKNELKEGDGKSERGMFV